MKPAATALLYAMLACAGCATSTHAPDPILVDVPHARHPEPARYAAGQIRPEDVPRLRGAGVRRVIDLTTASETPAFDERAAVEQAGMSYASLPVEGAGGLTLANVQAFDTLLVEAGDTPTLVHCGSGNRVGALIALRAAWVQGASPEQALAEGERWGLSGLRDTVAKRIADGPNHASQSGAAAKSAQDGEQP